jgi:hypothetical protein
MNLHDHQARIRDLELALEALASAVRKSGDPMRAALHDTANKLRAQGARSAAELLEGERLEAVYRR